MKKPCLINTCKLKTVKHFIMSRTLYWKSESSRHKCFSLRFFFSEIKTGPGRSYQTRNVLFSFSFNQYSWKPTSSTRNPKTRQTKKTFEKQEEILSQASILNKSKLFKKVFDVSLLLKLEDLDLKLGQRFVICHHDKRHIIQFSGKSEGFYAQFRS